MKKLQISTQPSRKSKKPGEGCCLVVSMRRVSDTRICQILTAMSSRSNRAAQHDTASDERRLAVPQADSRAARVSALRR